MSFTLVHNVWRGAKERGDRTIRVKRPSSGVRDQAAHAACVVVVVVVLPSQKIGRVARKTGKVPHFKSGEETKQVRVARVRGLPSMTSALEGEGGSRKVDKSTDKLRDHV